MVKYCTYAKSHILSIFTNPFDSAVLITSLYIQFTVPSIISGQPTVELVGRNATFTVTFATIESSSVTFNVVSTAVIELEVTATQGNAFYLSRNTMVFPADFPNIQATQLLITNLVPGTEYLYCVRVLTSNASNAMEIPRAVYGTFMSNPELKISPGIYSVS